MEYYLPSIFQLFLQIYHFRTRSLYSDFQYILYINYFKINIFHKMFPYYQVPNYYPYQNLFIYYPPAAPCIYTNEIIAQQIDLKETENQISQTTLSRKQKQLSQKYDDQDLCYLKQSKRRRRKAKPKQKIQNPYRNIMTNIGNQIIGFILTKKKSQIVLKKIIRDYDQEILKEFYQYIRNLKEYFDNYMNLDKFKSFFFGFKLQNQNQIYHKIIRKVSFYYLNQMFFSCFLTSQKLSKNLKIPHIETRRILLNLLKQGESFQTFR